MKALLIILGLGIGRIKKITEKKEKLVWAHQIMNELVERASTYKYDYNGRTPQIFKDGGGTEVPTSAPLTDDPDKSLSITMNSGKDQKKKDPNRLDGTDKRDTPGYYGKRETPLLIAAKMGIAEMVEKILYTFPVAIQDLDSNKKNVVLLAVENRQADVYKLLLKGSYLKESVLRQVDDQGNSALHLASMFGDHQPWLIPGAALQMQWEIKWYRFVKHSMPPQFFVHYNKRGENPSEIFSRTHEKLVKNGSKWLIKTSESCSLVAALIATVAFATSATVPGGANKETGVPILGGEPAFVAFSISSLIALCFSVTALVFFLAILTSRCQEKDFHRDLPRKLLLGLTSLFASIASMLVSFCAAHFFLLKDKLKSATFPIYAVTCLPVTFFAFAQLTLYGDLIRAILTKVPQRSYKVFPH
ncbi:ankyrin repeat-containing protein ITN1-like [Cornus florida]|uniref:ankyrin repeat-containing protein ITN1-like n=1 Tax=Cornus florida TaxID=4283 RepID=UPI0028970C17|nr:ankyrin repeat-containing protein ITN1-like [Cornus florida]